MRVLAERQNAIHFERLLKNFHQSRRRTNGPNRTHSGSTSSGLNGPERSIRMNSIAVSSIVFTSIFVSGLAGMVLRRAIPEDRLGSSEKKYQTSNRTHDDDGGNRSRDALSSAKASYDRQPTRSRRFLHRSSPLITCCRNMDQSPRSSRAFSAACGGRCSSYLAGSGTRAGRPQTS